MFSYNWVNSTGALAFCYTGRTENVYLLLNCILLALNVSRSKRRHWNQKLPPEMLSENWSLSVKFLEGLSFCSTHENTIKKTYSLKRFLFQMKRGSPVVKTVLLQC